MKPLIIIFGILAVIYLCIGALITGIWLLSTGARFEWWPFLKMAMTWWRWWY